MSDLFLHVDPLSNRLVLLGEEVDGEFVICDRDFIDVWQSPACLRASLRYDLMNKAVTDVIACEKDWSLQTAIWAFLRASHVGRNTRLAEVKDAWQRPPICTSVIISFWQRYLCELAQATTQTPMDLILKWMPLKADGVLPNDLVGSLRSSGWIRLRIFASSSAVVASSTVDPASFEGRFPRCMSSEGLISRI